MSRVLNGALASRTWSSGASESALLADILQDCDMPELDFSDSFTLGDVPLMRLLQTCWALTRLDLSNQMLSHEGLEQLKAVLLLPGLEHVVMNKAGLPYGMELASELEWYGPRLTLLSLLRTYVHLDSLHCMLRRLKGLLTLRVQVCSIQCLPVGKLAGFKFGLAVASSLLTTLEVDTDAGPDGDLRWLQAMPRVQTLKFSGLRRNAMKMLGSVLPECAALTELVINSASWAVYDNRFNRGNGWAGKKMAVPEWLSKCKLLATLRLHCAAFDSVLLGIVHSLPMCGALRVLDVQYANIELEVLGALTTAINACKGLEQLQLNGGITDEMWRRQWNNRQLKTLDMSGTLSTGVSLAACVKAWPQLTAVKFSNNLHWWVWGTLEVHCAHLTTLDMRATNITGKHIQAVVATVALNPQLLVLRLSQNELQDAGMAALAAVLPQCKDLEELDVGQNMIGAAGIRALSAVLPLCRRLATLLLTNNPFTRCDEFWRALIHCHDLRVLACSPSVLSPSLLEALTTCSALEELTLPEDTLNAESREALNTAVQKAPMLWHVNEHLPIGLRQKDGVVFRCVRTVRRELAGAEMWSQPRHAVFGSMLNDTVVTCCAVLQRFGVNVDVEQILASMRRF